MAKVERFEDLECYQLGIDLTVKCYKLFRKEELRKEYEFKSQMFAALISITNNISEGFEYGNNTDFIRFLRYAKGTAGESRNVLNVIKACELISKEEYSELYKGFIQLSKKISALSKYLQAFEKGKKKKDDK